MSAAEPPIHIDDRLRAMLLWDEPWLWSADAGARQWLRVLHLELPHVDELNAEDLVSVAAHLVKASLSGDKSSPDSLRITLSQHGDEGRLVAELLALWLESDRPNEVRRTLDEVNGLIKRVVDVELRARLLLRLAAFALIRGHAEWARAPLAEAVSVTEPSTRLGVVARRQAAGQGIDVAGFNPFARTDTPDDPLLTLPWVRSLALEAAAALSAERLEHELRGVWDTSFHLGRTKLDDLLAANAQAEWCGALDLRVVVRQLLSSHLLLGIDESPQNTRWALMAWATSPNTKRVPAAIQAEEDKLDATEAAELLSEVRNEGLADWPAYVAVAAGLWDLLDDAAANALLTTLVELLPAPATPQVGTLVGNLLWRLPEAWAAAFAETDKTRREAMLDPLTPYHVDVMPPELRAAVIEHRRESDPQNALDVALAAATHAELDSWPDLSAADVAELLSWRDNSVPPAEIESIVDRVLAQTLSALEKAHEGSWSTGDVGTRLLGELAAHLAHPRPDVVDGLLGVCGDNHAAAAWQFGALEGLTALRHASYLNDADIDRIRQLDLSPGKTLFGEDISTSLLRAAQLRVFAPWLNEDDVTWLATCARGTDAQSRLLAVAALGDLGNVEMSTVEWSLVSGLFDPSDEVVIRAIGAFAHATGASRDAMAVARARLKELYRSAGRLVRRQVVATAKKRSDLELSAIVTAARDDRAWIVRREAVTTEESERS